MSECKWAGKDRPRIVPGRHLDECCGGVHEGSLRSGDGECAGCEPCRERHCRVCVMRHHEGTCPECMAEVRESLRDIARMCDALPEEVEVRGVEGEAMFLLGPVADPEARGHVEASVAAGRVSPDYLAEAVGENHPLWVLGTWDMVYRDAFEHEEAQRLTLERAVDYLDQNLTYAGGFEHVPFEDFARDLLDCRSKLEQVLHDGEQRDTGAPCMTCGKQLERVWGADSGADGWKCPRCQQRSTEDQYRFAVMHLHRTSAEWLTDRDMSLRTGIKAGTIRSWSRPTHEREALVRKKRDSERTVYSVADVEATARAKGMLAA